MLSKLFNKLPICQACKKHKLFVKRRSFFSKQVNTDLTSNNALCRRCMRSLINNNH